MKKIAVVGIVGIPACYGGFESLVENLTANSGDGISYLVFCSSKEYKVKLNSHNNASLIYLPIKANGVWSVIYDILSLFKCLFLKPDVILVLGVSGSVFLPIFKFFSKCKVITNIDGLEWKRDKWGKGARRFLKWSESLAVKHSDIIVTDNQAITDYVLKEYALESKTISYGGDHAIRALTLTAKSEDFSLALCRIEPENNIAMILDAFSNSNLKLKFVGNWGSSEFGRVMRSKYSSFENIQLLDPIYDLDELYKLRANCSLYIHGHSAGGTNPSLVEMMHFGVPILAFDCDFNRFSTKDSAHYFKNSEELLTLLSFDKKDELAENAEAMKNIALECYTWEKVRNSYETLY
ncbi:DUF1972 domain-containing protein [Grimontia hollisae]|uniref:DUF1972 domain-containing protein n=1 Tax=Grimontia hollisae TaxID=673 RepID=UPI000DFE2593|nr:DUF1972 domain-containing protein [Grimontia hollisae]STQ74774.1 Domain of uncharacterised function (DUF1972) [Grimontia hollisae]